jgi:hypothetical protein
VRKTSDLAISATAQPIAAAAWLCNRRRGPSGTRGHRSC